MPWSPIEWVGPLVADVRAGVVAAFGRWRVAYTHALRTRAYRTGRATQTFGSLNIVRVLRRRVPPTRQFERGAPPRFVTVDHEAHGRASSGQDSGCILSGTRQRTPANGSFIHPRNTPFVSNTDDHLKNHGFVYAGSDRWRLSPAFDINPSPQEDTCRSGGRQGRRPTVEPRADVPRREVP